MAEAWHMGDFRGSYLGGVLQVLETALTADAIGRSAFVRKVLLDPAFECEGAPVALVGGRPVGFGLAVAPWKSAEDVSDQSRAGFITLLAVLPEYRRRGIGSSLLERCEAYLRQAGARECRISPYPRGYFAPGVDMRAYAQGVEFLLRRGYEIVSRPVSMACDLTRFVEPAWLEGRHAELAAEGFTLEAYWPERIPALMHFLRREFAEDWLRFAQSAIEDIERGESPERVFMACLGEDVVGFSHYQRERFGPIGVAEEYRGRGLGHMLMAATLRAMRREGYQTAWFLWSDDRTADRLYRHAGFHVRRRFAVMRKVLQP